MHSFVVYLFINMATSENKMGNKIEKQRKKMIPINRIINEVVSTNATKVYI